MQIIFTSNTTVFRDAFLNTFAQVSVVADSATPSLIRLRNPDTGVRLQMEGRSFTALYDTVLRGTVERLDYVSASGSMTRSTRFRG